MKHKRKLSFLLLLVFIIGALASMPLSVSAATVSDDSSAGTFKVTVNSNVFGKHEKTYDASTKHIEVVYEVNMPGYACVNYDMEFTYDKDVLTYNPTVNKDDEICPVAGALLVPTAPTDPNFGEEGILTGNFSEVNNRVKMYGKNGATAVFLKVVLDVKNAKDTTVNLNVKTFRICDETKLPENESVLLVKKYVVQVSDAELAKLNTNDYSQAISLPGDPDDSEFIVKTTSNLFGEHIQKYDSKKVKQIEVVYELNYPGYSIYNADFEFTYDPSVLTYNATENTKSSICPVAASIVQLTVPTDAGFGVEGSVSGLFSDVNNRIKAYGANGSKAVFFRVVLDVAPGATGTTVVDLNINRMKMCDEKLVDQEFAVVTKSAVVLNADELAKLNLNDYSREFGVQPTEPSTAHVHTVVIDKAVPATCKSTGLTEGSHCSVCGEVIKKQEVTSKTAHTVVTDKAVPATCKATGLTQGSHCSVCGEVIVKQEVTPKTAHTVVTDKAVPATCKATGLTQGSHCSVCGEIIVKQEVVPKTSHTVVTDKAVPATCTETGLTEGSHCSVCGEVIKKQEVVKALGHSVVVDKAVPATCTETGLTEGSHCSRCNTVIKKQEVVKALGHNVVIDKAVPATCTEIGYTQGSHCSRCNEVIKKQEVIPSKGHTPVIDEAVPATCQHTGLTTGLHCSVCNTVLIKQEVVPKTSHTVVTDKAVPATCKATGLTQGSHCSVCGEVIKKQEVVPKLAHTVVTDKAVPATCTGTGLTQGSHCSVCGEVIKAQTVVSALGHNYQLVKGYPATATKEGLTDGIQCTRCHEWLQEQKVIPKLGTEVLIGDVNMDGKVNGQDAGILARYTSNWNDYDKQIKNWEAADVNRDGKVNGQDAGILSRYTSNWTGYDKYIITVVV